jgi:hypothetical protein
MNKNKLIAAPVFILLLLALFNGCASWDASSQESLLSAAGFKTRTPSTPQQEAMFARMAPYTVERRERHGKILYAYADKNQHVVYIGGEAEYQRYKQLGVQKSIRMPRSSISPIGDLTGDLGIPGGRVGQSACRL